MPAILIQIDYSYDTGFFTNNPAARAAMQQAATDLGNSLSANLSAIAPSGGNTWSETFFNPATGAQTSVPDPTVGTNTIRVYVGGRALAATEGGAGGPGGYSLSGTPAWISTVQTRGWNGYATWGGSITFDTTQNWFFGATTSGLTTGRADFYTAATHELGHVLGIGTSSQWTNLLSGNMFVGPSAEAVYGGPVPISPDRAHWADGVTVGGGYAVMDPVLQTGQRETWTALDSAALRDLGWYPSTATLSVTTDPPAPADPAPVVTRVPLGGPQPVALAGATDGTVGLYLASGGILTATGVRYTPFAGYRGEIRVAAGDFNGDGVTDYAFATGAGPQTVVEILNGRDGSVLVNQTIVFPGFRGGLFLAAGDIDRDGIADLVISADAGAGPHIQSFRVVGGGLQLQSSFFAFDNPAYRGGARVAVGDINRDGFADVVVTTGGQAEGRVAVYSGADLRNGIATRLVPDFIPFAGLWAGLNAAVGDMDGDGFAELVVTPDVGGPAHVKIWSGATLTANPSVQASALPLTASFYGLPPSDPSGARLALRDTDGDDRADLVVVSGNRSNGLARVFTFSQVQAGGGGAPASYPLGTPYTVNGVTAALHTDSTTPSPAASDQTVADTPIRTDSPTTEDKTYTVTVAPPVNRCTCSACQALARLANPDAAQDLVPSAAVIA